MWRICRQGFLLPVVALFFSGCATLGPDYQEPEVDWLQQWQPDLYGQRTAADTPSMALNFWWRQFNDPALNALIAAAQQESPGAKLAGLRVLESRAVLGIADSTRYPQLQQLGADAS